VPLCALGHAPLSEPPRSTISVGAYRPRRWRGHGRGLEPTRSETGATAEPTRSETGATTEPTGAATVTYGGASWRGCVGGTIAVRYGCARPSSALAPVVVCRAPGGRRPFGGCGHSAVGGPHQADDCRAEEPGRGGAPPRFAPTAPAEPLRRGRSRSSTKSPGSRRSRRSSGSAFQTALAGWFADRIRNGGSLPRSGLVGHAGRTASMHSSTRRLSAADPRLAPRFIADRWQIDQIAVGDMNRTREIVAASGPRGVGRGAAGTFALTAPSESAWAVPAVSAAPARPSTPSDHPASTATIDA
jgi:hypothetical protein